MKKIVMNEIYIYSLFSAKQLQHNLFADDLFPASQWAWSESQYRAWTAESYQMKFFLINRDFKIQRRGRKGQ